jgi:ABC-type branched-subunit amino acid transport system substrate-binding protein
MRRATVSIALLALLAGCTAEPPATSGEPIRIGFANNESGPLAAPDMATGARVAVDHLNAGGGIDGRPIEIVGCASDGTTERSEACARMFVARDVAVVVQGVDLGADAALPVLAAAKIPFVGHVQFGPAQMTDPNSYFFGAASLAYGAAALKYYADQELKTVSWLLPEAPSSHAFTDGVLLPAAAKLGLTYESIYYDTRAPDWDALARTVADRAPDVGGSIVATEEQCASMVRALHGIGFGGRVLAASCSGLHKALGGQALGVDLAFDTWNVTDPLSAPPTNQAEITIYLDAMQAAGHSDPLSVAAISFADVMTLSRVFALVDGSVDARTVSVALAGVKNLDSFLGPAITCDRSWHANSACSTALLFYRFQPNGALKAQIPDYIEASKLAL